VYTHSSRFHLKGNQGISFLVTRVDKTHLDVPSSYNLPHDVSDNAILIATACAFNSMFDAAKKNGVKLLIDSAFRTVVRQEYLYHCYLTKSCNNGNLAAIPGTSNHGFGLAVDINQDNPGVYSWLKAHAHQYGFIRTVDTETWHWEHRPGQPPAPYT